MGSFIAPRVGLPGTKDFSVAVLEDQQTYEKLHWNVPGAKPLGLVHDENPYVIKFPTQEFVIDGHRKRMNATYAEASIVRWEYNGHVIAYTYRLTPVIVRRVHGKWVIHGSWLCDFSATFIDDQGDGVFRVLVQSRLT
jgi:hypothetical protein